jgi:ubiquinone/menaquinone biosynthesis C-methylase UbiE
MALSIVQQYNQYCALFNTVDYINFMNHGYYPKDSTLNGSDLLMPYSATLYKKLLDNVETSGLKILDVGCGRGGGVNTYKKYFDFEEIHGCDNNEKNLNYCNSYSTDINFKLSDAQKLEYPDNYFDIVTNVESMHRYENVTLFLSEVSRALKPNGVLVITDVMALGDVYKQHTTHPDLKLVSDIDITKNVTEACKHAWEEFKSLPETDAKRWSINLYRQKYNSYAQKKEQYRVLVFVNNKAM